MTVFTLIIICGKFSYCFFLQDNEGVYRCGYLVDSESPVEQISPDITTLHEIFMRGLKVCLLFILIYLFIYYDLYIYIYMYAFEKAENFKD